MTLVIAHRGASAYAPENTLRAFELAAEQGAEMCELDVQPTADGTIVVFHDHTTERWNGQPRSVQQMTLAELQQVDIGGERAPTLAEVCDFARSRNMRLNVELKGPGFARAVADVIRDTRSEDLVIISSFWVEALREMASAAAHIPRGYLMGIRTLRPRIRLRESWPFRALRREGVQAWHPAYQLPLLRSMVPRVRAQGYRVHVWTVNEPLEMQRLLALHVDGIITDRPDVLRKLIDERGHA